MGPPSRSRSATQRSPGSSWPASISQDALDRADTDTKLASNLADAHALGSPVENLLAMLIAFHRSTKGLAPRPRSRQSSVHALADHGPLKLSEHAKHLEHGAAGRSRRVEPLLVQVEVNVLAVEFPEEANKVLQ